ncbi:hypothetical protein M9H77_02185 [Catharanthus roseus]|uniref:Uncharacterized protein n=1 Tax=Catharanthus roseus TaxID=4058 RepID=A0ACC0C827_CATRO|nr:hypothetical protein M9H77_02185 [Catharanthus roseus]
MNQMSQSPLDLRLGPITRAQIKKLKLQEDDGMIAYMEDALKSKVGEFEDQGKHPKLLTMCSIFKEQSKAQLEVNLANCWEGCTLPPMARPLLPLPVRFCLDFPRHWQPTADRRFYPPVASRFHVGFGLSVLLDEILYIQVVFQLFIKGFIGFSLECRSYKSSIKVLQEGGDLGKDLNPMQ